MRLSEELCAALAALQKAVFSEPTDKSADSRVTVRPVLLGGARRYQAERIRDNKAFHQNLDDEGLLALADNELDGRYRQVLLVTDSESRSYVLRRNGGYKRTGRKPTVARPGAALDHNREKEYILREGENIPALVELGIFTADLKVVRSKYDKYRQINRFIELIDDEAADFEGREITILDFGCGKSYLTFIIYYYFNIIKGIKATIIGYDLKADVVDHCNRIAEKYGYERLSFVKADVTCDTLYDRKIDMVVTLHACDVATDYALYYAVTHGAKRIFSVPCCQHEVNATIKTGGELDILLRRGIVRERVAALLTDSIRAGVLEDMGYEVDMIEFVDLEHSPKNIMLRAKLSGKHGTRRRDEARTLAEKYGFEQTLLKLTEE